MQWWSHKNRWTIEQKRALLQPQTLPKKKSSVAAIWIVFCCCCIDCWSIVGSILRLYLSPNVQHTCTKFRILSMVLSVISRTIKRLSFIRASFQLSHWHQVCTKCRILSMVLSVISRTIKCFKPYSTIFSTFTLASSMHVVQYFF